MADTYTGDPSNTMYRSTYQMLTSTQKFSKMVQWACFTKTPFLKAAAVEAFGVDAMKDLSKFGAAKSNGRMIRFDSGNYAMGGQVFATTGSTTHVGRLGSFNPELVEGGDEWSYAWHRLISAQFIPDVDVQDNTDGLIDIKAQKLEGMKQKYVQDINYCFLGNSSAPNASVLGPSAVYSDLPNLISVDQTRTVGGISKSGNTYWNNGYKAITSVGGGGEMDRPLTLRRGLMDATLDQAQYAETTDDYLLLTTQGGWQYYDRLMYADSIQGGKGDVVVRKASYDAAGVKHKLFDGIPIVYDPAVTVPYAASAVTAGTEVFYGIHIPSFFISFRSEEAFLLTPWEEPRNHDNQRTLVAQMRTRYTPGVSALRPHFVCYNIPACPD